ncbi:bgs4, partial [Symbiodinium sp. CCMP2456]
MREVEYARRKRGHLRGWSNGLVLGLLLVLCVWPGISLEGFATAAAGTHCTLPCDTLQEVRCKKQDLPKYLSSSAHPDDTLPEIRRKIESLRQLLTKFPWPKLKCFCANGRTYSLPLRAVSREPSHRPAKARLEYLAGFFDGDGCVSCVTDLSGCKLVVGQSYDQAEVLMLFREAFGGSISRLAGGKGLIKPVLFWQVCGDSARRAARLLALRSITKQKQLLIAARWPKTKSLREDCKAELRELKEHDSAGAGSCSWSYFAGFFDAEGCIKQCLGGASLQLAVSQKHPRVLRSLRDFLKTTSGIDATLEKFSGHARELWVSGLPKCKQILRRLLDAGLLCKAKQAQLALSLTPENAAEVRAELAGLTGNQRFGKGLDAAGQERARKIHTEQWQAARLRRRGLHAEVEAKQRSITKLKQEHELLKAHWENQQLTDGEAMQQVFGVSWRMVWSRIVEALYEDCVISSDQANAMVKAGSTVRWENKENLQTSASPQDQFSRSSYSEIGDDFGDGDSGMRRGWQHLAYDGDLDYLKLSDLRRALVTALREDKGMQSIIPFSVFDLSPGSRLIAVNDSWPVLKDEMIEELSNASLPALLVFQRAGASFHEVEVELQPPARVKSMSFMTGKDVPGLDPVCWKVEGFVADAKGGGRWKQLVWQDKPYAPPFKRETDLCVVFDVEHWRVDTSGGRARNSKVQSITLQSFLPVVQERLSFFTASLRSLLRSSEKYGIRAGIDTLLDSHIGNIPSLTQVIPCYNETVILSKQYLQEDDGLNSNLAFIISQFPEEWAFFCERHDFTPKGMHDAFMGRGDHMLTPAVIMEVRMWASMRSQTVARTVVGAMQYQEVVAMLPSVQSAENPGKALESCVELVLAHQTYGSKAGTPANDESVRYLLAKYRHLCFFLVFDFDADKSRPDIVTAVNNFVREKYRFDRPVRHASVLARFRKGAYKEDDFEVPESAVEILEVLPRCFALLVGTPGFMTQGKAGNQLGALRFSRGHFLQMMDANMGAFLGEATKVPFILRRFQPHWTDRTTVRARIIGFREFIFTESHGAVGSVMASAEWSFGTICQRFLAGLGARMHYGHPDFLDGFWASNRGSLSKASPAINLSEDIFAGFN